MTETQQMEKSKSCCGVNHSAPKLRPLGNRVLVRRLEAEEKLKGGIILPDTAKKKQEQAKSSPSAQEKKIKMAQLSLSL